MFNIITKNIFLLSIICIIIYTIFYIFRIISSIDIIDKSNELNELNYIEKKYGKKYPLGNDKFKIIHYPKYNSFFEQFNNYIYMIKKENKNIIATCCFVNLTDNIYYICDLKKIIILPNITFYFIFYFYLFCINMFKNVILFGIVMEPNSNIDNIANKFGYEKIKILKLYKIKFSIIKKHYDLFNEIFPNFIIVRGYKKFILESDNSELTCYHIAEYLDSQIIKLQKPISFDDINDNTDIMFCIDTNNKFNEKLYSINIKEINLMNIISNKQIDNKKFNIDKIKTYMI
jgi:hypothetical protein